ncbi:hypothetical protein Tco_0010398 [Tanacetum coccineum]
MSEVEQDDWSMEFDAEHMHFGQDGLLILPEQQCMKQPASSRPLMLQSQRSEILGYQMSLESLEVMLKTHEKNEYAWGDKYEQIEYDLKIRIMKQEEKQRN